MTKQQTTKRFLQYFTFAVLATTLSTLMLPALAKAALSSNTQVAEIFDEPLYRVELRYDAEHGHAVTDLQVRVVGPVLREYRLAFQQLFEPKSYEMQAALNHLTMLHMDYVDAQSPAIAENIAIIDAQLATGNLSADDARKLQSARQELVESLSPPDLDQVWSLVTYWKFQRHLYDVYGGGRVVMQPYGPEAIDATANWLKLRELEGDFTITDPQLREAFYEIWKQDPAALSENVDYPGGEALSVEAAQIAEDLRYDRNRYRLLNPNWMRALYKSILETDDNEAAAVLELGSPAP